MAAHLVASLVQEMAVKKEFLWAEQMGKWKVVEKAASMVGNSDG